MTTVKMFDLKRIRSCLDGAGVADMDGTAVFPREIAQYSVIKNTLPAEVHFRDSFSAALVWHRDKEHPTTPYFFVRTLGGIILLQHPFSKGFQDKAFQD